MKKPVVIVIRDGWGEAAPSDHNAVTLAKTPVAHMLEAKYPWILMNAKGEAVGLPHEQMGNSEVGHLNIGAGRVVYQSLSLIDKHISDNTLKDNKVVNEALEYAKKHNSRIHILGLLSDGGVHSHINHIIALDKIYKQKGFDKVFHHFFTDGRDVSPDSAPKYIDEAIKNRLIISSIGGRYFGMDRDKKWDREQLAYDVIADRKGASFANPKTYIQEEHKVGRMDEFITPAFNSTWKEGYVKDNDVVIFANFRPDRTRQLSHLLVKTNIYPEHDNPHRRHNLYFATMMKYDGVDAHVIFPVDKMHNLLGDVLEQHGLTQMRAAETEKYPHVTFFMDGGDEIKRKNEIRILVNSPKVATYDLQPEMSAVELTDKILANIEKVDAAIINYANPDMVGHTANVPAIVKAVETTDTQIGRLYHKIVEQMGGVMMIFADHGNAEKNRDENGKQWTAHTTNPVKLIITSNNVQFKDEYKHGHLGEHGTNGVSAKLGDIAPTMLKLLNIPQPKEMDGKVLIK